MYSNNTLQSVEHLSLVNPSTLSIQEIIKHKIPSPIYPIHVEKRNNYLNEVISPPIDPSELQWINNNTKMKMKMNIEQIPTEIQICKYVTILIPLDTCVDLFKITDQVRHKQNVNQMINYIWNIFNNNTLNENNYEDHCDF